MWSLKKKTVLRTSCELPPSSAPHLITYKKSYQGFKLNYFSTLSSSPGTLLLALFSGLPGRQRTKQKDKKTASHKHKQKVQLKKRNYTRSARKSKS